VEEVIQQDDVDRGVESCTCRVRRCAEHRQRPIGTPRPLVRRCATRPSSRTITTTTPTTGSKLSRFIRLPSLGAGCHEQHTPAPPPPPPSSPSRKRAGQAHICNPPPFL